MRGGHLAHVVERETQVGITDRHAVHSEFVLALHKIAQAVFDSFARIAYGEMNTIHCPNLTSPCERSGRGCSELHLALAQPIGIVDLEGDFQELVDGIHSLPNKAIHSLFGAQPVDQPA